MISEAEDLVPALTSKAGAWFPDSFTAGDLTVRRYRPRIEGAFSRIERWTNTATTDTHWRCIIRDNVTSVFGLSVAARIADP